MMGRVVVGNTQVKIKSNGSTQKKNKYLLSLRLYTLNSKHMFDVLEFILKNLI